MKFRKADHPIGGGFAWTAWAIITLATVWQFVLQTGYAVVSPDIQAAAHLTISQVGVAAATYTWAFGITQFFSGALLDRYTSWPLLWVSIGIVTAGAFLYAVADSFLVLLLAQAILGIGSSFGFVGAGYVGSRWFKASWYGIMFGLVQTAVALGSAITQPVMQLLLKHTSWRSIILVLGFVGLGLTVASIFYLRDPASEAAVVPYDPGRSQAVQILSDLWHAVKNYQVILSALIAGSTFGVMMAIGTLWGPRIIAAQGADVMFSTLATGAAWLGLAVGAVLLPAVARRGQDYKWPAAIGAGVQMVAAILILFLAMPHWASLVTMFIFGLASGVEMLGFAIAGGAVAHRLVGAAAAVVNAICFIISGLLTSIPAAFLPAHPTVDDFQHTLWAVPLVLMVGVIAALLLPRWRPSPGAAASLEGKSGWSESQAGIHPPWHHWFGKESSED